MGVDVLTVSTKGQIVLPASVRSALSIKAGDKLAAYTDGECILLRPLKLPSEDEFAQWLDEMRELAAEAGLTEGDVADAIAKVRKEKRAKAKYS